MSTIPPVMPSAYRLQSRTAARVGPTGTAVRRSRLSRLSSDVVVNRVRRAAHAAMRRRTRSASAAASYASESLAGLTWTATRPPIIGTLRDTIPTGSKALCAGAGSIGASVRVVITCPTAWS